MWVGSGSSIFLTVFLLETGIWDLPTASQSLLFLASNCLSTQWEDWIKDTEGFLLKITCHLHSWEGRAARRAEEEGLQNIRELAGSQK